MKFVSPSQRGTMCQWRCPGQAGTGGLALVEPDIVTLRSEHPIEDHDHLPNRLDRLEQVGTLELAKRPAMQRGERPADAHCCRDNGSRRRTEFVPR